MGAGREGVKASFARWQESGMQGKREDGGVLRLDVAPNGEVTWIVGEEGRISDDAAPEDGEDVCGRRG
jgi:hypothetical protein